MKKTKANHTEAQDNLTGLQDQVIRDKASQTTAQDSLARLQDQVIRNKVSYAEAQADLARLLDQATRNDEIVLITRRGRPPVALIPAAELRSLLETVHVLRTPASARRLFDAMEEADRGEGIVMTVEELVEKFGLTEALTKKRLREQK